MIFLSHFRKESRSRLQMYSISVSVLGRMDTQIPWIGPSFLGVQGFGCLGGIWVGLILLQGKTILVITSVNKKDILSIFIMFLFIFTFIVLQRKDLGTEKAHIAV